MTTTQSSETPAISRQRLEGLTGLIDTLLKQVDEVLDEEFSHSELPVLNVWKSVTRGDTEKAIREMVRTGILEKKGVLENLQVEKLRRDEEVSDPLVKARFTAIRVLGWHMTTQYWCSYYAKDFPQARSILEPYLGRTISPYSGETLPDGGKANKINTPRNTREFLIELQRLISDALKVAPSTSQPSIGETITNQIGGAKPTVRKDKPRRGRIGDYKRHGQIAAIVKPFGPDWKRIDILEKIATALDKEKIPPRKSWSFRTQPSRTWSRAVLNEPDLVIKAIDNSLKMARNCTRN